MQSLWAIALGTGLAPFFEKEEMESWRSGPGCNPQKSAVDCGYEQYKVWQNRGW